MKLLKPREAQCLPISNPFVLARNEFTDGLRADSMQVDEDHKDSASPASLSTLPFAWSHLLRAHLLSLPVCIKVSLKSDLRPLHFAMYLILLLSSSELFALTNCKL